MSCQHPIPLLIVSLSSHFPSFHTLICTLILLPSAPLYGKAALLLLLTLLAPFPFSCENNWKYKSIFQF